MTHPARKMAREQARQARREAVRSMNPTPPPTAGAIDLAAMRGGDKVKQQEMADNAMKQQGFLCSCGERFRDEGVAVMGYNLGVFPEQKMEMTPRGPQMQTSMEDGCQFIALGYHSRRCPDFLDAMKNGIDPGAEAREQGVVRPRVRAIRELPKVEWLDELGIEQAA